MSQPYDTPNRSRCHNCGATDGNCRAPQDWPCRRNEIGWSFLLWPLALGAGVIIGCWLFHA
jgi:hypothetical protein